MFCIWVFLWVLFVGSDGGGRGIWNNMGDYQQNFMGGGGMRSNRDRPYPSGE